MAKTVIAGNALGVALKLAETKYKDNIAVQTLHSIFLTQRSLCNLDRMIIEGYYDLDNYLKGLDGVEGYSTFLGRDTVQHVTYDPIKRMLNLKDAQVKGECLILVLQALGEEIEY